MKTVVIKGKEYSTPIYLPDATRGYVRSLSTQDLNDIGVKGAVVNTYHLLSDYGLQGLHEKGGIKGIMGYEGLIVSDSGGWQVFSLIHRNGSEGQITDEGVVFSFGGASGELFTPEKSIQMQFEIGSDIIICLDDFTPPNASFEQVLDSVERTTLWAKRCKAEYEKQLMARGLTEETRPYIFAVIQGDRSKELRAKSAYELIEIGFDGYGYGGYMIDENGGLDREMSAYIANLIPQDKLRFALGTGTPWDIAYLYSVGWDIFDCTLPTRDARHKRLYTFNSIPTKLSDLISKDFYGYIYIDKGKYSEDNTPLSELCDCSTCRKYTKADIYEMFKEKNPEVLRLATIHNLSMYIQLIEYLKTLEN